MYPSYTSMANIFENSYQFRVTSKFLCDLTWLLDPLCESAKFWSVQIGLVLHNEYGKEPFKTHIPHVHNIHVVLNS